jgi:hypothetical protein
MTERTLHCRVLRASKVSVTNIQYKQKYRTSPQSNNLTLYEAIETTQRENAVYMERQLNRCRDPNT